MNHHNGLCVRRDLLFKILRVQGEGLVDFGNDRDSLDRNNRGHRRKKGVT